MDRYLRFLFLSGHAIHRFGFTIEDLHPYEQIQH
ncbi:hypothetical protein J2Z64_001270 [Oceanobacillus polygoni]|uniref:Uncharacterized protein n=1 Tax=Oceanobacillus polygoni TaxID=1235259 RepID=A0A9X0YTT5_9BACI|nr:hypothetical protein [Oceanobacillus polygoni]